MSVYPPPHTGDTSRSMSVYNKTQLQTQVDAMRGGLEQKGYADPMQLLQEISKRLPAPHNQLADHLQKWEAVVQAASTLLNNLPAEGELARLISNAMQYPRINTTFIIPKIELKGPTGRFPPPHAFLIGQAHYTWQEAFKILQSSRVQIDTGRISEDLVAKMRLCTLLNPVPMQHLFFRAYALMLFGGSPSSGEVIRVLENIGRLSMTTLVSCGNALGISKVPYFEWSVYGRQDRDNLPETIKDYPLYPVFPVGLIEEDASWWIQPTQFHHWSTHPRSTYMIMGNARSWL